MLPALASHIGEKLQTGNNYVSITSEVTSDGQDKIPHTQKASVLRAYLSTESLLAFIYLRPECTEEPEELSILQHNISGNQRLMECQVYKCIVTQMLNQGVWEGEIRLDAAFEIWVWRKIDGIK